jgi:hypothetical protein
VSVQFKLTDHHISKSSTYNNKVPVDHYVIDSSYDVCLFGWSSIIVCVCVFFVCMLLNSACPAVQLNLNFAQHSKEKKRHIY